MKNYLINYHEDDNYLSQEDFDIIKSDSFSHLTFEEKSRYISDLNRLRWGHLKYGMIFKHINKMNYPKILEITAKQKALIVGGEGHSIYKNVTTLNLNRTSNPNVVGDINGTTFPNEHFDVIFFERVGFVKPKEQDKYYLEANINSFMECHRLLKQNGRLLIITGKLYHTWAEEILSNNTSFKQGESKILDLDGIEDVVTYGKNVNVGVGVDNTLYTPLHFIKISNTFDMSLFNQLRTHEVKL